MQIGAVLILIGACGLFRKGTAALIQTVQAAVTQDACLRCQLTQTKQVLMVTWYKIQYEKEKIFASYNIVYGQRVNSDLEGKVAFEEADQQNSSIIIRNVTEQDEGCYHCVFTINNEDDFKVKTCLQVYELQQPALHIRESDSSEETTVSCSVTARPAPTVKLRVLQQDLSLSDQSSVSVNNTNGTVTVTATALLSGHHGNSTQVGCVGRVLSVPQVEVIMTVPEVKHTTPADISGIVSVPVVIIVLAFLGFAIKKLLKLKTCQQDQETFGPAGERAGTAVDVSTNVFSTRTSRHLQDNHHSAVFIRTTVELNEERM